MPICRRAILFFLFLHPALVLADRVYTMGVVPQYDSRTIEEIWSPILKQVAKRAGIRIKLVGAPSIPEFEKQFEAGAFDMAYMNPYHVLISNRKQGYMPVARDVGRRLHGIIVVRKDSKINAIHDLEDKAIAFPSPNALGASLIPRAEFARKYRIKIHPKYVNSHDSVYLNVALGQADAGGGVQKTFEQQPREIRESLRVIYRTRFVAPHPIVVHPRVPGKVAGLIQKSFIELGQSDHGRELLRKVPIGTIGIARMSEYKEIGNMGLDEFFVKE